MKLSSIKLKIDAFIILGKILWGRQNETGWAANVYFCGLYVQRQWTLYTTCQYSKLPLFVSDGHDGMCDSTTSEHTWTTLYSTDGTNFPLFIVLEKYENSVQFGFQCDRNRCAAAGGMRKSCRHFTFNSIIFVQISHIIILQLTSGIPAYASHANVDLKCIFFSSVSFEHTKWSCGTSFS